MPRSVVIVGGSMSGLLHGLQHKRQGSDVTILEQDPSNERCSHNAGVRVGKNVIEMVRKYDRTGVPWKINAQHSHVAWGRRTDFFSFRSDRSLTSWGLLYRLLRANFDGLASPVCPAPPGPLPGDGAGNYLAGKRTTELKYSKEDGVVTVYYVDVTTGETGEIEADLVIGADGIHSTVRKLVKAPITKKYAGYVSWRGTVKESDVSKATAEYFDDRVTFALLQDSYIVLYIIPTDEGRLERGERLINWLWYCNVPDGSAQMAEIFTDVNGKTHYNTVLSGLVRPAVWRAHFAAHAGEMGAPFAEVLAGTSSPFVTKINDGLGTTLSYHDGHVVLTGDAYAAFRPNVGLSTEQAALHCTSLERVWEGLTSLEARENELAVFAVRTWYVARLLGEFGRGTFFSFVGSVSTYLWYLAGRRLWGAA